MTVYLVDTSVAVALVLTGHTAHDLTNREVGKRIVHLAGHAAVETYSVLTRLPGGARVAPGDAQRLLTERFAGVICPKGDVLAKQLADLAAAGIKGGAVYDGLVSLAASVEAGAVLLTRDLRAAATYARLGVAVEMVIDGD